MPTNYNFTTGSVNIYRKGMLPIPMDEVQTDWGVKIAKNSMVAALGLGVQYNSPLIFGTKANTGSTVKTFKVYLPATIGKNDTNIGDTDYRPSIKSWIRCWSRDDANHASDYMSLGLKFDGTLLNYLDKTNDYFDYKREKYNNWKINPENIPPALTGDSAKEFELTFVFNPANTLMTYGFASFSILYEAFK